MIVWKRLFFARDNKERRLLCQKQDNADFIYN